VGERLKDGASAGRLARESIQGLPPSQGECRPPLGIAPKVSWTTLRTPRVSLSSGHQGSKCPRCRGGGHIGDVRPQRSPSDTRPCSTVPAMILGEPSPRAREIGTEARNNLGCITET
jgi:hypothetical protein